MILLLLLVGTRRVPPLIKYIGGRITNDTRWAWGEVRGSRRQKRRKSFVMTQMYCCSLWKLNHVCARESNRKWCSSLSRSSRQTFHFWVYKIRRDNIIYFISLRKKLSLVNFLFSVYYMCMVLTRTTAVVEEVFFSSKVRLITYNIKYLNE